MSRSRTKMATEEEYADILLKHISSDIKDLQAEQCDLSSYAGEVTLRNRKANALCEHLDMVLRHQLLNTSSGYWKFVSEFTRSQAIKDVKQLSKVKTDLGRGRAWLFMALNEQSLEAYFRNFQESQSVLGKFYKVGAIVRNKEKLILLQTLLCGLDYVVFNLQLDFEYLDMATCDPSTSTKIRKSFEASIEAEAQLVKLSAHTTQSTSTSASTKSDLQPQVKGTATDYHSTEPKISSVNQPTQLSPFPSSAPMVSSDAITSSLESFPQASSNESSLTKSSHLLRGPNAVLEISQESSLFSSESQTHDSAMSSSQNLDEFNVVSVRSRQKDKKGGKKVRKQPRKQPAPVLLETTPPVPISTESDQPTKESSGQPSPAESKGSSPKPYHFPQPQQLAEQDVLDVGMPVRPDSFQPLGPVLKVRGKSLQEELEEMLQATKSPQESIQEDKIVPEPTLNSATLEDSIQEEYSRSSNVSDRSREIEVHSEKADLLFASTIERSEEDQKSPKGKEDSSDLSLDRSSVPHLEQDDTPVEPDSKISTALDRRESYSKEHSFSQSSALESEGESSLKSSTEPKGTKDVLSFGLPERPMTVSQEDMFATEVMISQKNKLLISLNVCFDSSEILQKLIQVFQFSGKALLQLCFLLITNDALYVLENSEGEAGYSRITGCRLQDLEDTQVGLNWQSLTFVYGNPLQYHMIVTCDEAITRGIAECLTEMTVKHPKIHQPFGMSKGDKLRWRAIQNVLPLQDDSDVELYCIAYWEQLDGDMPPPCASPSSELEDSTDSGPPLIQGTLQVKSNKFGVPFWKPAFLVLRTDALLQYNSETDLSVKLKYPLHNSFGGCKRLPKESRPNSFMVTLGGVEFTFSGKSEDEVTKWMQVICEAAIDKVSTGVTLGGRYGVLLTEDKIHILQEDWKAQSMEQLSCCRLEDIECVSWDPDLPLYCVVSYDNAESELGASGSWLFCFSSAFELGKFERGVAQLWEDTMKVQLEFTAVQSDSLKRRAEKAVELLKASRIRSDSVTKGRSFIKQKM